MKVRHTFMATGLVAVLALAGVTAAIAADPAGDPPPKIAFLANGIVPADALAAGPIAGQLGAPVYTTQPDNLSTPAADALAAYNPELVIVLGGPVAIQDSVLAQVSSATGLPIEDPDSRPDTGIVRAAGEDRFETASIVAELLASYDPAYLNVDLKAVDADMLDGMDSSDFLGASEQAADADQLDGRDSSDFLGADLQSVLPVAVINVAANGTVNASQHRSPMTGAPTVDHAGTGQYYIALPGASYHYVDDAVVCTPLTSAAHIVGTNSASSDVLVEIFQDNGVAVNSPFSCAIYDLS